MGKGIKRGIIGGVFLALAATNVSHIAQLEAMSPNEIADELITDQKRQRSADVRMAVKERKGPFYQEIVAECKDRENDFNRSRDIPLPTVQLAMKVIGAMAPEAKTFNMNACIDGQLKINDGGRGLPEKGYAGEEFKSLVIGNTATGAQIFGAIGAVFMLGGAVAFTRRRSSAAPAGPA